MISINIPRPVESIIEKLNTAGFEAFAVGGCVRDTLLGRQPGDWDITTSARPEEVKELFNRTVDTGISHGTVTVLIDRVGYEITTYRIDGEYEDGRHPRNVEFTSSLHEDLRRRDFTINAMAYSHRTGVVDAFDGMTDLKKKIIRCVGCEKDRFGEDALRILRAVRFSAQLDFSIEGRTKEAVSEAAPNLKQVSRERILAELNKLLLSEHPERISMVFETGMARFLSPGIHSMNPSLIRINGSLEAKKHLRWAAFLRQLPPEEAVTVLKTLKSDNDTILKVQILLSWWRQKMETEESGIRRMMSRMEDQLFDDLLMFKEFISPEIQSLSSLKEVRLLAKRIRSRGDCVRLKDLAVTGRDLIAAGMMPGQEIGNTLSRMLEDVIQHPEHNFREFLVKSMKDQ